MLSVTSDSSNEPTFTFVKKRRTSFASLWECSAKYFSTKDQEYEIPVPPLAEQQRIVGMLDKAFDGIAKANAEKNLQNARWNVSREVAVVRGCAVDSSKMNPLYLVYWIGTG